MACKQIIVYYQTVNNATVKSDVNKPIGGYDFLVSFANLHLQSHRGNTTISTWTPVVFFLRRLANDIFDHLLVHMIAAMTMN